MGLNKLMRRRVSELCSNTGDNESNVGAAWEDEDKTTSVRAITLHCELREEPDGLLVVRSGKG